MIHCEFQNIKKLEVNKVTRASETFNVPSLNEFLLNVSSDQVKISADFDS